MARLAAIDDPGSFTLYRPSWPLSWHIDIIVSLPYNGIELRCSVYAPHSCPTLHHAIARSYLNSRKLVNCIPPYNRYPRHHFPGRLLRTIPPSTLNPIYSSKPRPMDAYITSLEPTNLLASRFLLSWNIDALRELKDLLGTCLETLTSIESEAGADIIKEEFVELFSKVEK